MSRETEFLTRHKEDLRQAAELCHSLQKEAVEVRPRQKRYMELKAICKRLEGSCRQMAHERGDDFTWLQMAHHYHRVSESVSQLRKAGQWLKFGAMAEVFGAGLARLDRLATAATGLTSRSTSPLLILPSFLRPRTTPGGIILPE